MKYLKMSMMLLLTAVFFTSCEKETTTLPENSEMNIQKNEIQSFKSLMDIKESGIDLQSYINSLPKQENKTTKQLTSQRVEDTNLQFFYSPDDFPCSNLPTEDFEEGNNGSTSPDFIDENTASGMFSPGDILPGVSIHTMNNSGESYNNFYLTDQPGISSKALFVNYFVDYMIIDFTTNDVTDVNMDVFSIWGESEITIEVFGSSGSLGTTSVYGTNAGTYWGVISIEPITQITLYSLSGQAEGIDNLSFGTCFNDDYDNDGVLNEDDPYPNSNMSEKINIDGCYPNVNNVLVRNGTTMMDQIDALIAEINLQYTGRNYDYLNRKFIMELERKVTDWRRNRLVNNTQRDAISRCARSARIPYSER